MNQGTFSDYHWKAGDILIKYPPVGGAWNRDSFRGIFHALIGDGVDGVIDSASYSAGTGSRLSKN